MCGIAGILAPGPVEMLQASTWAMVRAQAHRGPDDEGVETLEAWGSDYHLTLGCSRLAVIDLSSQGHQPMQNEDGTVWVAFNGEIYNFGELRRPLESKGYRFRSRTDTEVMLRLYEEHGEDSIGMLNGMFAVAIWDQRKGRLLLARDRMGEKPLYYTWAGQKFLFASEIRALLASGDVARCLDMEAVGGFFTMGSVPSPLTIIQGVRSLEPGCFLSIPLGGMGRRPSPKQYWSLVFEEDPNLGGPEAPELFREHLLRATQSRLVSDVPVGVFLSGGLDSSAIVSQVREKVSGKLRTFSLRFEDPRFDEGPSARLVAERFETDHVEQVVTADDVLAELNPFLASIDQPSIDGVNIYFVSKLARSSGVVVALSGLGGDELLGGYSSFRLVPKLCKLGGFLNHFGVGRKAASASIGWLSMNGRIEKLQAFLKHRPTSESAFLAVRAQFGDGAIQRLLSPEAYQGAKAWDPSAYLESIVDGYDESLGNRISRLELATYMPNQLLRDSDTMSMAHSLEVRAPFLDNDLVDFLSRVPSNSKYEGKPKSLLIDAMKDTLPLQIIENPKRGFSFPIDGWLRREWKQFAEETLFADDHTTNELFDRDGLRALWTSFLDDRVRWSRVWAALILKLWVIRNIGGGNDQPATYGQMTPGR